MRMARQTNIKSPGRLDSLARAEEKGAGRPADPTRRAGGQHSCSAREEDRSLSSPPQRLTNPNCLEFWSTVATKGRTLE
jgi:hypothetical protein